jgi:hypothetical protein
VWCKSKEKAKKQRLFEPDRKGIFPKHSKQTKAKAGEKMDR